MAAATVSVSHNVKSKTIVYTFSAKVYFDLLSGAGVGTKIEGGATVDISKFAFYKTALDGTYAVPAAESVDANCTIESITFPTAGTTLTVVYEGVFPVIAADAFGYICYPILYAAYTDAADTDSSANHIQACFTSPVVCPITNMTSRNAECETATALAISATSGAVYTPVKRDEKCILQFTNTDSSNAETVKIYHGDHIQAGDSYLTFSIAASGISYVQLTSGRFKHIYHDELEGKIYIEATADVKVLAIELP